MAVFARVGWLRERFDPLHIHVRDKPGLTTRAGAPILHPRKQSAPLVAELFETWTVDSLCSLDRLAACAHRCANRSTQGMVKDRFTPTR